MAFTDSKEIERKRAEIVSYIRKYIAANDLSFGGRIQSENELSRLFNVNRNTVRAALESLKVRGVLYSQKGKGFFVAEKPSKFVMKHDPSLGLSEIMDSAKLSYRNSLLGIVKRKPSEREIKYLQLSEDEEVFFLSQLRYVNDIPFALCYSTIPVKLVPGLDAVLALERDSFKGTNDFLINKYGFDHPVCSRMLICSFAPGEKESKLLSTPDNVPILQQENIYTVDEGTPIEYFVIRGRSDMFKISLNLN